MIKIQITKTSPGALLSLDHLSIEVLNLSFDLAQDGELRRTISDFDIVISDSPSRPYV
jgi:hypothetical protein